MMDFITGYINCALWSSTDDEKPLDANFGARDLSEQAAEAMVCDCLRFTEDWKGLLSQFYLLGLDEAQAGHDFWLTRNGHGTGFWDRRADDLGEELAEAATAAGETDLYLGDDGVIYST